MKILIVDDEQLARERLRALVSELGLGEVIAEASNGREALSTARAYQPEVVLLDIRMPGLNGMQTAQQLSLLCPPPAIIFTTAYGEHALEAFEQQAVDYLMKPIRKERLEQALKRARSFIDTQRSQVSPLSKPKARTHISAYIRGEIHLIPVKEIYYFYASQKYVALHWIQGEVLITESLKDLEQEFAGQFLRIHRSTLVAIVHIASLNKSSSGGSYIKLKEIAKPLEVSRRHLPTVKRVLKDMRIAGSS